MHLVNIMNNRNVRHITKQQARPQRQCETVSRALLAHCKHTMKFLTYW